MRPRYWKHIRCWKNRVSSPDVLEFYVKPSKQMTSTKFKIMNLCENSDLAVFFLVLMLYDVGDTDVFNNGCHSSPSCLLFRPFVCERQPVRKKVQCFSNCRAQSHFRQIAKSKIWCEIRLNKRAFCWEQISVFLWFWLLFNFNSSFNYLKKMWLVGRWILLVSDMWKTRKGLKGRWA